MHSVAMPAPSPCAWDHGARTLPSKFIKRARPCRRPKLPQIPVVSAANDISTTLQAGTRPPRAHATDIRTAARVASRSDVRTYSTEVPSNREEEDEEFDVVVVGAGLGGLCAGAVLAKYGHKVLICESHSSAGGAAHAFIRRGFHFDSGPSFHAGLSLEKSVNPLKHVLDILGEEVPCIQYKSWVGHFPGGQKFIFTADTEAYRKEILRVGGKDAHDQWLALEELMAPVARAAVAIPAAALRQDPGNFLTIPRYLLNMLPVLPSANLLLQPFSVLLDKAVRDAFLRSLMELECFVLSGMLPDSTISAEIATMFFERNRAGGSIDYPVGGGASIVNALVRGFQKYGGQLRLNTHVGGIDIKDGRACGVLVRDRVAKERVEVVWSDDEGGGQGPVGSKGRVSVPVQEVVWSDDEGEISEKAIPVCAVDDAAADISRQAGYRGGQVSLPRVRQRLIKARRAVISNASIWDTARLLEEGKIAQWGQAEEGLGGAGRSQGAGSSAENGVSASSRIDKFASKASRTSRTGSFMHLHLGIDATGLPSDLECHHLIVNDWEKPIDAPQNVVIISIASIFDPSLAPPGCHTVHVYTAGNEPYEIWEGLDRGSEEYKALKEQRSQVLWEALEQVIPDVRQRSIMQIVGTPLTHERYLRRYKGTYGPAVKAGKENWPGPISEIPGLICCGDSTMPGIGVPAVAGSGLMAANSVLSIWDHLDLLQRVKM